MIHNYCNILTSRSNCTHLLIVSGAKIAITPDTADIAFTTDVSAYRPVKTEVIPVHVEIVLTAVAVEIIYAGMSQKH